MKISALFPPSHPTTLGDVWTGITVPDLTALARMGAIDLAPTSPDPDQTTRSARPHVEPTKET